MIKKCHFYDFFPPHGTDRQTDRQTDKWTQKKKDVNILMIGSIVSETQTGRQLKFIIFIRAGSRGGAGGAAQSPEHYSAPP